MDSFLNNSWWNQEGLGEFVAPPLLSNWVKADVPLSEAHANCSGHKNKMFSICSKGASLWLDSR